VGTGAGHPSLPSSTWQLHGDDEARRGLPPPSSLATTSGVAVAVRDGRAVARQ
jgi:hypothetical protein